MISLQRATFLSNTPNVSGRHLGPTPLHTKSRVAMGSAKGDVNGVALTQEGNEGSPTVIEVNEKSTVAIGGSEDVYGEDSATEDQLVTPWALSVASGYSLLRDPRHNKGLAFTEKERDAHYLRGLLPPAVVNQPLQVKKMIHNIRQYQVPLQKYMAMMDLQERNEKLFYRLLIENVEELLPVVYSLHPYCG